MKPRKLIAQLKKLGFEVVRISGSHYILENPSTGKICVVPVHGNQDIPGPVVLSILKQAGISPEEFSRDI